MKLLVLGGTVFLGRHVVQAALDAGHGVTLFNRGRSGPTLFPGVETLLGDRGGDDDSDVGDLSALDGLSFDAVIDCSGYKPAQLARTGAALAGRVAHYLFVSSISVHRHFAPGVSFDETAAVLEGDEGYGAQKARSEEAIVAALPGRVTCVRPGLIVGPYDPTGRFTYWPQRVHRGGDVLAPGRPDRLVQWIDARDLAAWCVRLIDRAPGDVFNAVGPTYTMRAFLDAARSVTASAIEKRVRLVWVPDEELVAAGVTPWTELPLWIPESDPEFGGLMLADARRAQAAGLICRSMEDTIAATLAWSLGPDSQTPRAVETLTPQRERELLASASGRNE